MLTREETRLCEEESRSSEEAIYMSPAWGRGEIMRTQLTRYNKHKNINTKIIWNMLGAIDLNYTDTMAN